MNRLIDGNPMFGLFYSTANVALTAAILLFVAALVAFGRRNPRTGFGLLVGTAIAGFGTFDLTGDHQHRTWVTPTASVVSVLALLALTCAVAQKTYSVSLKVVTINAIMLMAAVAVAMGAQSMTFTGYGNQTDWITADDSSWFAIFALACSLVFASLAYAVFNKNSFTLTQKTSADSGNPNGVTHAVMSTGGAIMPAAHDITTNQVVSTGGNVMSAAMPTH